MAGKSILAALFFSFATFTSLLAQCDCVTTGNCPVPIQDNGVFNGYLDVTVNGANDLAVNPLTSVCVTITHTWIGDLSISLTSPSGVSYLLMADAGNNYGECGTPQDNAEICIVPGTNNPLSNNTEYVCNSAPCSVGTCCLNGDWTVACGGVTSPITGVQQAPNCDLNDFNIAGQPANGTWTISILDVCNMDVGTLENFSLTFLNGQSCYACESDGGVLDSIVVVSCVGDPSLDLSLPPDYGTAGPLFGADSAIYDYVYLLVKNGVILDTMWTPDLTSQPPGNYVVYGLSYLTIHANQIGALLGMNINDVDLDLESSTASFCGDLSENGVPVTILPVIPTTILNDLVCEGDCITVAGQQICGDTTLLLNSWRGCDSLVQVNLTIILPDTVDVLATVCHGGGYSVGGQMYFPPNPQYIHLQNWQGCDSVVHLTFNNINPSAIITPASPPAITCTNGSVALSAATSGPGTLTYAWSGPGSFTSNQANITATTPGTYTVTVSNNSITPACTATASATVNDGRVYPDLSYTGTAPSICLGASFNLSTLTIQDANNTGAAITIHSGTPATPANQLSNTTVSPTANTTYYFKATVASCTDEIPVTLTVKPVPTANFTATPLSCLTSPVTVNFTGTALAGATYTWDFAGGTATPGTGPGPHTVTFPSAGPKTLSLTVTQNGCPSTVFTQNITVDNPLAQPVISCQTTTSSIIFSWNSVPGSTGYNVTSSIPGTQVSPTSYEITGLTPGQSATITVAAIGTNSCGNSSAQQTCTAQDCPTGIQVLPTPVNSICRDANTSTINLFATILGGDGTGTLTWSGPGVIDGVAGIFDPNQANLGSNTITATYVQSGCPFPATMLITVSDFPNANLTATPTVCVGDAATVTFAGTTGTGYFYNWNFNGGTATPGTGSGPQLVTWSTAGPHTVSVNVSNSNGCSISSPMVSVMVETPLAAPNISCNSTSQSVTFTWPAVAGATSYLVNVPTGQTYTQNSATSYTISGLSPGEVASIEVTAVSGSTCANSMATSDCAANPCPTVSVAIDPVADICRDASTQPIQLVANVTGGSAGGTLEWFGQGVSLSGMFNPNQAILGANTITAIYTEGPCNFTQDININVNQTPMGGFAAPATVCVGSPATITYNGSSQPGQTYTWDFGGGTAAPGTGIGPHTVTWSSPGTKLLTLNVVSQQGCASPIYTAMVDVVLPIATPQITCGNTTTTSIEFTWPSVPGATSYTVSTTTGQIGTQTSPTTYLVSGLNASEQVCVNVTAISGNACPSTTAQFCCTSLPCPGISVAIAAVPDFCLGTASTIQLSATVAGDNGTGIGNWSGNGIINTALGTFSPSAAGFGQHIITYTYVQDGCSYTATTPIGVFQQPTASFTADAAICLSDFTTIAFTGVAGANPVYTWDFDGGTAVPGIGPGPHQVEWDTPGPKNISLTITDGSCTSNQFTQTVQVDDQILTPVVDCSPSTNGVVFTWNAVAGATGYTVTVTNGPAGVQTSDTSYVFSGLNPSQQVGIQVSVNGSTGCALPVVQASCTTQACPTFTVEIQPFGPYCLTANTPTVQLVADVDGVGLSGTGIWSGNGVVNASQGVFDPTVAGVGLHKITYTYQQANCVYQDEYDVQIVAPPTADAGPDRLLTCWESDQQVQLGGPGSSSGLNIVYQWTAASGSFPGEALIRNPTVDLPGLFTLTVTNSTLGCANSDEVLVSSTQSSPVPTVGVEQTYCNNGGKDGKAAVSSVTGGMEPYLYSLNDEPFVTSSEFPFLDAGDYTLTVMDAEGCTGMASFRVEQAGDLTLDLTANIVGQAWVNYGNSIELTAITNLTEDQLDSIFWTHADALSCTDCLTPVATPKTQTTFEVTVYKNGCEATDSIIIYVNYGEGQVYVPSAFSPNDDGVNDQFLIYSGPTVKRIRTFYVFDRWGELVHEYQDFDPKDPARGWNGKFEGQPMNPQVFVWFAEVEFEDGSTKVLEGDVTLMR